MSFENDLKKKQGYYKRRKQYFDSYKRAKGCEFCGYSKCASALDFHHIGEGKEFNISQCSSLKKIKIEIMRCIVLCRNCHAELHESREGGTMASYERIDTKELEKILQILSGQGYLSRIKKEAII